MGKAQLKVELVAWTQGRHDTTLTGRGDIFESHPRIGIEPTEIVSRAAGISHDKEERENHANFVKRVIGFGHESVLEHVSFTFRVEGVSRALTHQWVRHRLCSFTQRSQRYVKEKEISFVMPPMEYLFSDVDDESNSKLDMARRLIDYSVEVSWKNYLRLLELGVKAEDARFVLPNACETKMVWTANARELRHFFKLRMDLHAQWEIRRMACYMFDLVYNVSPTLFGDFVSLRTSNKNQEIAPIHLSDNLRREL